MLFVSHNMNAIEQLCGSCIMLENGRLTRHSDDVRGVVKEYLFGLENHFKPSEWVNSGNEFENSCFKPLRFYIGDENTNIISMPVRNDTDMWIYVEGMIKDVDPALQMGYAIYDEDGALLYWSCHTDGPESQWPKLTLGASHFRTKIPERFLNQGNYKVELILSLYCRQWLCQPGLRSPQIHLSIQGGLSDSPYWMVRRPGILAPMFNWEKLA